MDVLELLKNEDDNPRGREGGRFVSGDSLEEAAAAEQKRRDMKKERLPIGRQEAGILHLMTAKTLCARLNLAEPRLVDGEVHWNVTDAQLQRAYDVASRCCAPEWSFHPKRDRGYAALREAYETLSNENGKRGAYLREAAEEAKAKEDLLAAAAAESGASSSVSGAWSGQARGGSSGVGVAPEPVFGARAAASAAAAEAAAELEQQMAAKRKRMLLEEKLRAGKSSSGGGGGSAFRRREEPPPAEDDDDDDDDAAYMARAKASSSSKPKAKKPKRAGMM